MDSSESSKMSQMRQSASVDAGLMEGKTTGVADRSRVRLLYYT